MSFLGMYWGAKNDPNKREAPDQPPVTRVRVDGVTHGHTPDKHRKPAKGHEDDPIQVQRGNVVDGNARLYAARQRGDKWIQAQVWE